MSTNNIDDENRVDTYQPDDNLFGKKVISVPKKSREIGIDTDDEIFHQIAKIDEYGGTASQLNTTELEAFTRISDDRNTTYDIIDTMSEDPTIAAALEIYAEDATETSQNGDIMWVTSDDPDVTAYITYLLDTMNVNKNLYKWAYSLCKYGDIYLKLFHTSDYEDHLFDDVEKDNKRESLNEDIIIKAYGHDDKYSHYMEMVANPAEMFELTKFGKSYAYINAPSQFTMHKNKTEVGTTSLIPYKYQFNKSDIKVYDPTSYVHGSLEDGNTRFPEEVEIFMSDNDENTANTYTVRRGQSILFNTFKIWRQMNLLENAMLLNRITRSSIVKLVNVEMGDQPKEEVRKKMLAVKQLFENKTSLNVGESMSEYNNPGPIENIVYVPTHNNIGTVSMQEIGGNPDVKGLSDIDFFKNKLYASLKIPKQYLGDTDDATGFNGGTSLSIVSSRYAKTIKRIQNTLIQTITDAINLMLLDKDMDSYINKFQLKMQEPTTKEDLDRKEAMGTQINMVSDIMNLLQDIEDPAAKLKILKILLADVIPEQELLDIIEEQGQMYEEMLPSSDEEVADVSGGPSGSFGGGLSRGSNPEGNSELPEEPVEGEEEVQGELPSPADLNAGDFTDNNMAV